VALLQEHTAETGQAFTPEARDLVWSFTNGQPWLVNALAYETTWRNKEGRDRTQPITGEMIQAAKENLILRRVTHLDQLADKRREPCVRRVVEPMLRGDELGSHAVVDDIQYVVDLGLVARTAEGPQIANPIYREVIPRELTVITQLNLESQQNPAWYIRPDGRLDMARLLAAFQQFFRENSEVWLERFDYKEAGPQLLMQAFLQRIINGGGRVDREYGLGRRRTDLLVVWNYPGGVQRAVIELKLLRDSLEKTLTTGLAQTWEYADRSGAEEAHLVIFDLPRAPRQQCACGPPAPQHWLSFTHISHATRRHGGLNAYSGPPAPQSWGNKLPLAATFRTTPVIPPGLGGRGAAASAIFCGWPRVPLSAPHNLAVTRCG
jgi:hypothetical protein